MGKSSVGFMVDPLGLEYTTISQIQDKDPMNPRDLKEIKLVRNPLWVSGDGLYVVVEGPFPANFVRSADAPTVKTAAKRGTDTPLGQLTHRAATESAARYAKTLARLVNPAHNDWGEVGL